MPCSMASRLAAGTALGSRCREVSSLPEEAVLSGSGVGSGAGAGAEDSSFLGSSFCSAGAAASPPASAMEKPSKAEISAPSSTRTAIGWSEKKSQQGRGVDVLHGRWVLSQRETTTYVTNGDILLALVLEDLGQHTLLLELKVHLSLVRLDLDQDITRGNGVAGLLLPGANVAGGHGWREGGHLDDGVRRVRGVPSCQAGGGGQSLSEGVSRLKDLPSQYWAEHAGRLLWLWMREKWLSGIEERWMSGPALSKVTPD